MDRDASLPNGVDTAEDKIDGVGHAEGDERDAEPAQFGGGGVKTPEIVFDQTRADVALNIGCAGKFAIDTRREIEIGRPRTQ
jgi:hypothetical protein